MKIGVPSEIKAQESRVGLTPQSVNELVKEKHTVLIQKDAGVGAGFSIAFVVFSFEIFLELKKQKVGSKIQIAAEENIKFDRRSKLEVLNYYNKEKIITLPNVLPSYFLETNGLSILKDRIFPLGGISNQNVILDNELGYYPIIETDEFGFNNIKGLYNKNTDVLLIGDSFAEGYSVNSNQTISALLNKAGLNTLSLGKGNNGPLIEFATLREFISHLKPKFVFWLYCINDMSNLKNELKSTLLKNYLFDDNYLQNLFYEQDKINPFLRDFAIERMEEIEMQEAYKEIQKDDQKRFLKIIRLENLRYILSLTTKKKVLLNDEQKLTFKKIMHKSNELVKQHNGKLFFVYLSPYGRYHNRGAKHQNHDFIFKSIKNLNIPIIDTHSQVISNHEDPLSLFPFRQSGHYTPEGYKLIFEKIFSTINSELKLLGN